MRACGNSARILHNPRGAPAGGENPLGFHPVEESLPVLVEKAAAWQAEHPLRAAVLPRRVRNAAAGGRSACRDDAGLGREECEID
ncbi:MAG: hypothetical protein LBK61_12420 [Spirochaetaceae bacterium]|nr:hypothetical protein [Spirochaetaceae bacterium]